MRSWWINQNQIGTQDISCAYFGSCKKNAARIFFLNTVFHTGCELAQAEVKGLRSDCLVNANSGLAGAPLYPQNAKVSSLTHTTKTGHPVTANDLDFSEQWVEREVHQAIVIRKEEKLVLVWRYLRQRPFKVLVCSITNHGQMSVFDKAFHLIVRNRKPWHAALSDSLLKGKNGLLLTVGKIGDSFSPRELITVRNKTIQEWRQKLLHCLALSSNLKHAVETLLRQQRKAASAVKRRTCARV